MKLYDIHEIPGVEQEVLDYMKNKQHEKVVFCSDEKTGLKAIIAIHNTNLGPALGGTRMWEYPNTSAAIKDVLRLSRGMTYKAAITGLNLGGGKAVIMGDSNNKTDAMMTVFGKFVNSLNGQYITAEDVGMTTHDMKIIYKETKHVVGKPKELGGSGDPSVITAYGTLMGIKGCAFYTWGKDSLKGKKVLVQGLGNVGRNLIQLLTKENADIYVNDINPDKIKEISKQYHVNIIKEDIYSEKVDIYAPCALGGTLNETTIPKLKCAIVAGAANNQLAKEYVHDDLLKKNNIIYAPDFLINAGGLINVYSELKNFSHNQVLAKTEKIFDTTIAILKKAEEDNISTQKAALKIAREKVLKKHCA